MKVWNQEQAIQHLNKGNHILDSYGGNICECVTNERVTAEITQDVYNKIKEIKDQFEEILVLIPGYTISRVLISKACSKVKEYEVEVKYVNRPNDPIKL